MGNTSVGKLTAGLILALAVSSALAAGARDRQSLDEIRVTVERFLKHQSDGADTDWQVSIHRLDPRLRLHACHGPLQAFAPNGRVNLKGRTTVGVRCTDDRPWKLYVPVSIDRYAAVVVASRALTRGQRVVKGDLRTERRNLARLPYGYYTSPDEAAGMAVKQPLRPGEVLRPGLLAKPMLVHRGQELLLVADTGSVTVSMSATALEDGARGQRIRVRNRTSRRVVEATVLDSNRVRVGTVHQ